MAIENRRQSVRMLLAASLGLVLVLALGGLSQVLGDGPGEVTEQLKAPLIKEGIAINPPSLIKALQDKRLLIAGNAALLLGSFPKTRETVHALNALVAEDQDERREMLSVNAARSLVQLNERQWAPSGIARLPKMRDRVAQVQLAGLLARTGHADGWAVVKSTLLDPDLAIVATENLASFDGLKDANGRPIDLRKELEDVAGKVPDSNRKLIEQELFNLRGKRSR